MSYDGPERRLLPREESLPPNASAFDRALMRLSVIKRLLMSGHLEREQQRPGLHPRGSRA